MTKLAPLVAWLLLGAPAVQDAATTPPQFSDYPALGPYSGPPGVPRLRNRVDQRYRNVVEEALKNAPDFASEYKLAKFQIGNGPLGVLLVDVKSGLIFHLPPQVGLFLLNTGCLARYKLWQKPASEEADDSNALTYSLRSELLIVRRCVARGVEKSYFRWHNQKWTLLARSLSPPPPPQPVP